jgi:chromosomal replication initiation ATPase DnaA
MMNYPKQAHRDAWCRVRDSLRRHVGNLEFQNWLEPLELERVENRLCAILTAPTRVLQHWVVSSDYYPRLLTLWQPEDPRVSRITIVARPRTEDEEFGNQMPNDPVRGSEAGSEHESAWCRVLERLSLEVGSDVFDWLRRLELDRVDPIEVVTLVAPNAFVRHMASGYGDLIFTAWREEYEHAGALDIVCPLVSLQGGVQSTTE